MSPIKQGDWVECFKDGRLGWELPIGKLFKVTRISSLAISLEGETRSFDPNRFCLVPRPKVSLKPRITNAKI